MTPTEFKQWIDGFLSGCGSTLTDAQVKMLKDKLNTVISEPQYNKFWYYPNTGWTPHTLTQPGVSGTEPNNIYPNTFISLNGGVTTSETIAQSITQNTVPIHLVKNDDNIGGVAV